MPQKVTATPSLVGSVLHPTDFSPAAENAFAHALAISLLRKTYLTLVHVTPDLSDTDWTGFPAVRATLERWGLLEEGSPKSAVFDELRVRVTKLALQSRFPVLKIKNFLDRKPVDLIVLATQGREGLSRWVDRSDAEAMARWSRTMTLFVPASAKRGIVSFDTGNLCLKNILVPIDRAPDCAAAVEFARRTAELLSDGDVAIRLLYVGTAPVPQPALEESDRWTWHIEHREGDVVAEILSAADRHEANLIVMATTGHDGVLDALRGSTTEQVLRKAPCPILAVPA